MTGPEIPNTAYVRIVRKNSEKIGEDADGTKRFTPDDPIVFLVTYFHPGAAANLTTELDLSDPESNIKDLLKGIEWMTHIKSQIFRRIPTLRMIVNNGWERNSQTLDEFSAFLLQLWKKHPDFYKDLDTDPLINALIDAAYTEVIDRGAVIQYTYDK